MTISFPYSLKDIKYNIICSVNDLYKQFNYEVNKSWFKDLTDKVGIMDDVSRFKITSISAKIDIMYSQIIKFYYSFKVKVQG